jgi:Cyclin, N-terminal domain
MDFERSTQARSWLFDKKSLYQCREKVISDQASARKADGSPKVRKFASGFGKRQAAGSTTDSTTGGSRSPSHRSCEPVELIWDQSSLTSNEQAILVRFHAHQMSMLVGPTAILPSLVRGPTVLATAIMLFRRFYLSNSVLDFSPRRMAVAAAFLASKVEDQKVEVSLLSIGGDTFSNRCRS